MGVGVDWGRVFRAMRRRLYGTPAPSVTAIAERLRDPFRILIATMISLRTKDEVTAEAAQRLLDRADTPHRMLSLGEEEIATLIYPAGFYRTKAKHIRECSRILVERHGGAVPDKRDALLELPGVGVKTANLTLNLGFGIPAICVDTHVHRISNRLGWVSTSSPEKTEKMLEVALPRRFWIEINRLLVSFGKEVCVPISPFCSTCPMKDSCPRVGVERSR